MASGTENRYINVFINGKQVGNTAKEISAEYKKLQNQLRNTVVGSKEYNKTLADMGKLKKHLDAHNQAVRGAAGMWSNLKTTMMAVVGGNLVTSFFQKMVSIIPAAIQQTADLSDAIADVQKTSGMTQEDVEKLSNELNGINTRTSREELMKLAAEGGKLGKGTVKDLKKFVQEADKIKVSLGEDLGEDAITQIGKLSETFETGMLNIGSAVNSLGAAGTASEGYLVDFLSRVAPVGKVVKATAGDILGFGAVLDEAGLQAEISATALSDFFMTFVKDTGKFEKAAGMAKGSLKDLVANGETTKAMNLFLENLNKTVKSEEEMLTVLDAIGIDGDRGKAVFLTLSQNIEKVKEKQEFANQELLKGTSIIEEFDVKNNTFGARVDKTWKRIQGIFSGTIKSIAITVFNVFEGILNFIENNAAALKKLGKWIAAAVLAFIEMKVAIYIFNTLNTALKKIPFAIAQIRVASVQAGGGVKSLAAILKGLGNIGVVAIMTLITEAFMSMKSATDLAAEAQERFNNALQKTKDDLSEMDENFNKSIQGMRDQAALKARELRAKGDEKGALEVEKKLANAIVITHRNKYNDLMKDAAKFEKNIRERQIAIKSLESQIAINNSKDINDGQKKVRNMALEENIRNLKLYNEIDEAGKKEVLLKTEEYNGKTMAIMKEASVEQLELSAEASKAKKDLLSGETAHHKKELDYQLDELRKQKEELIKLETAFRNRNLTDDEQEIEAIREKYEQIILAAEESKAKLIPLAAAGDKKAIEQLEKFNAIQGQAEIDAKIEIDAKLIELQKKQDDEMQKNIREINDKITDEAYKNAIEQIDAEKRITDATKTELQKRKDDVNAHYDELIALAKKYGIDTTKLEKARTQALNEIDWGRVLEATQAIESFYNEAKNIYDGIRDIQEQNAENSRVLDERNYEARLSQLEGYKEKGLLTEEEFQARQEELEAAKRQREAEAKKIQWEKDHRAAIIDSTITTILATVKALASGPPVPNFVGAAIAGTFGAAQTALIAAQKPPEFGIGGILPGRSHAQGGMNVVDPYSGAAVANIEGGELLLSKNFSKNNPEFASAALYASQNNKRLTFANLIGPQASMDHRSLRSAIKMEKGGYMPSPSAQAAGSSGIVSAFAEFQKELKGIRSDLQNQSKTVKAIMPYRDVESAAARVNKIRKLAKISKR